MSAASSQDTARDTRLSITVRTALLTWIVSIVTLLVFVVSIVPEQKRSQLNHLRSRARGLAVSLGNVAASAVVNEDYSSVVEYCSEILKDDPSIEFIVLTRKDGYSLLHEKDRWTAETLSGLWRAEGSSVSNGIQVAPLFERRVFLDSRPMAYSGVEWGWIHIGLSLADYDQSMRTLYWRSFLLALGAVVMSLAISLFYARLLVRPLLALKDVVARISGGDLRARATPERNDEIGRLALAVNGMADAILQRDKSLKETNELLEQRVIERSRELAESELRFSEAFNANPLPMAVLLRESLELLIGNPSFLRQFGLSVSAGGRPTIESDPWRGLLNLLTDSPSFDEKHLAFEPVPGSLRHLLCSARSLTIQGRNCVLCVFRDVTDHRRAEEERRKLHDQLMQSHKMESVGRLAGGVAHDFNNMLLVIIGYADMALSDLPTDHPVREYLWEIRKSAKRSADLTKQLLAFARRQTITPKVQNLNETVSGMNTMLQRLIGEKVRLVWAPEQRLWPVRVDSGMISQILVNLVVNARDAIAGNGVVTLQTANVETGHSAGIRHPAEAVGTHIMLLVSDNGRGMDEETRSHLFEPFFTTKELGKGTGLGLATVFGIVSQHDGLIQVDSEPGKGSSFRIYFPRAREEAASDLPKRDLSPLPRGHGTVLFVEDEPQILALGSKMLEPLGFRVLTAQGATEALALASTHARSIRLLITDVVMPGMNGRELRERMESVLPGVPCIFVSGYAADIIQENGIEGENIDLLHKPFTKTALGDMITKVLSRGNPKA